MEKIDEFILKDGRKVDIVLPEMKLAKALTDFVNKLSAEDTFLTFAGERYSVAFEKNWLKNVLNQIKFAKANHIWAIYENQIIGSCSINKGGSRDNHVGLIGLMVDKDFRNLGLGRYLVEKVITDAPKIGIRIVSLDVFDDNIAAKSLYKKIGFKEWGRLPKGFVRRGKYTDSIKMYKNLEDK